MNQSNALSPRAERHTGPHLLVLIIFYVALLLAGGSKLSAAFNIPHDSAKKAVAFVAKYGWSIQLGSFFELLSAIPLGLFIATTISRLRFLGVNAAGESIAFLGGIGATVLLMLSALANWSLTRPGIAESTGAVQALRSISFASAGPAFVILLGFFVAGVSLTAGQRRLIPRSVMWLGIAVAVACELATLTVLNFTAGYLIPVGRFISIIWMIGIALKLPLSIPVAASENGANPAKEDIWADSPNHPKQDYS